MKNLLKMIGIILTTIGIFNVASAYANTPKHMIRTKSTHSLNARMISDGRSADNAKQIINVCKAITYEVNQKDGKNRDASLCVKMMSAVATAESSRCTTQSPTSFNCFGIMKNGSLRKFESISAGMVQWAYSWTKYRYKHDSADDMITKSKYCTAEDSSGTDGDCPNRRTTVDRTLTYLNNSF